MNLLQLQNLRKGVKRLKREIELRSEEAADLSEKYEKAKADENANDPFAVRRALDMRDESRAALRATENDVHRLLASIKRVCAAAAPADREAFEEELAQVRDLVRDIEKHSPHLKFEPLKHVFETPRAAEAPADDEEI